MSGCFCSGRCGGDPAKCPSVGVTTRDIRDALEDMPRNGGIAGKPPGCCGECGLPPGHEPCDGGILNTPGISAYRRTPSLTADDLIEAIRKIEKM